MTTSLEGVRVFIASPGGLGSERRMFRDALRKHNEIDANQRGVNFIPVGWEDTLGGLGRPQGRINEDIRTCDYMVLAYHDRWGSPPGAEGESEYTSGTEEEYFLALECVRDPDLPMKDVVVFFKTVDPVRLAAPDDQLRRVLDFRRQIEREAMYETCDDAASFEQRLRRHLAKWVRDHETGTAIPSGRLPDLRPSGRPDGARMERPEIRVREVVRRALELAAQGRLTDAEVGLATAVVRGGDIPSLIAYGYFLLERNRVAQAQAMFERAVELAEESGDPLLRLESMDSLAHAYIAQCRYTEAEPLLVATRELGDTIFEESEPGSVVAPTNLAVLYILTRRYAQAEELLRRTLRTRETYTPGDLVGIAQNLDNLANAYAGQGKYAEAEEAFLRAADLSVQVAGRVNDLRAAALDNAARMYSKQGKHREAEEASAEAISIFRSTLGPDHEATHRSIHNRADIYRAQGKYGDAASLLLEDLEDAKRQLGEGHPVLVPSLNELADLYREAGLYEEAETLYWRSIEILQAAMVAGHPDRDLSSLGNMLTTTVTGLGGLLCTQGRYGEAQDLYRRLLDADREERT